MSSDQVTGDRGNPDHARLKILRAADTFDRRDHVMTAAAYQLHVTATAHSADRDQPGFVPAEYLASLTGQDLHSPAADPAALAAELCSAGMWRRVDGGYRVLDWPAVQMSVDHVRELRTVDKRPPARHRQHHAPINGWSADTPGASPPAQAPSV
jgi:hypothetical protein